jgi:hypothetical protein
MKTQLSPAVVVVVVLVVLAAVGVFVYTRAGAGEPQSGARMPDVVAKELKEHGPRPMPPMPMPGGGMARPQGGAVGAPTGAR